jgi:hypothetical protein
VEGRSARANALLDSLVDAGVRLRYYLHRACTPRNFIEFTSKQKPTPARQQFLVTNSKHPHLLVLIFSFEG